MFILKAQAVNDLEIPFMVFETKEQYDKWFNKIKEEMTELGIIEHLKIYQKEQEYDYYIDFEQIDNKIDYEEINKLSKEDAFIKKFFTRYYFECGGPGPMKLIEVKPGEPFIQWDLD